MKSGLTFKKTQTRKAFLINLALHLHLISPEKKQTTSYSYCLMNFMKMLLLLLPIFGFVFFVC